ncbi:MAG: alpha/beta fold hydrolase [Actinomycetota bacterium]
MRDGDPPPPTRTFSLDTPNGALHVEAWGAADAALNGAVAAPPALLVHGVNGSTASWATVVGEIAGRRPLLAIDLRGRGSSSHDGPWGVGAHADDLVAAIDTLAGATGEPISLVGHSFGAHVVACAALRADDELVADLLLIDGGPPRRIPDDGGADAVIDGALGNILPQLDGLPFPVSVEAVAADFASMVVDADATESLAATSHPLTLIRAEHGVAPGLPPIIDDGVLAALEERRPVLSTVIEGATHFSLLAEHANAVTSALLAPTMRP